MSQRLPRTTDMIKSRDGVYWFSTYGNGIWKYDPVQLLILQELMTFHLDKKTLCYQIRITIYGLEVIEA